jgi:hypothetical protein
MTATLDILRNESTALIHLEVRAGAQRSRLDLAMRDAIVKGGLSIDAVSEATGVAPKDIHRVLETPAPIEDLDVLLGVA